MRFDPLSLDDVIRNDVDRVSTWFQSFPRATEDCGQVHVEGSEPSAYGFFSADGKGDEATNCGPLFQPDLGIKSRCMA